MKAENFPKLLAYLTALTTYFYGVWGSGEAGCFFPKKAGLIGRFKYSQRFREWLTIFLKMWPRNLISSNS